jgi:hypothetical protein
VLADNRPGLSLPAQPTGQSDPTGPLGTAQRTRTRCGHRARKRSGAARWRGRRDLAGGLGVAAVVASAPMEQGGTPSKAVEGGAHPSGVVACWRWRMLWVAVFNGGEASPVTDDVDGVALYCREGGRR